MRTLTKRTNSFDKINSFGIEYKNWRGQKDIKGVYLMQKVLNKFQGQKGVTTQVGEVTNDPWAA